MLNHPLWQPAYYKKWGAYGCVAYTLINLIFIHNSEILNDVKYILNLHYRAQCVSCFFFEVIDLENHIMTNKNNILYLMYP
jgi:hypothetical protein